MYNTQRSAGRPATSAGTPSRSNLPRSSNHDREDDRGYFERRVATDSESDLSGSQSMDDRSAEEARETQKLNQIIQQFFVKGALIVVASRVPYPPFLNRNSAIRQNRWFNILMDDSEELSQQTSRWKTINVETGLPKTLTIDIYVDLQDLTKGKSCVISDDQGKRWDVSEAASLSNIPEFDMDERPLVLERWQFLMDNGAAAEIDPNTDILSNLYKKSIPIFRSLYAHARLLPVWKYHRRVAKLAASNPPNQQLKLKYRVHSGGLSTQTKEALDMPLHPNQRNIVDRFAFGSLQCPAGNLHASVTFRTNCDIRVDDSEALLSSQFMRSGEDHFKPSWPGRNNDHQVVGSAPTTKKKLSTDDQEQTQVYGSLSTFHTTGTRPSTSPISALRAMTSGGSPVSPSGRVSSSLQRAQESRASIRSSDGPPPNQRRQSISFNPFKAGSLASSPATPGMQPPMSPVGQLNRAGTSYSHRSRPSMTTLPQAILRQPSLYPENAVASSTSSSPRPAPPIQKFSSSFTYRKSRMSSGASKNDDERSSGKPSPSSSTRVSSDVLVEPRAGQASADSVQQDDDNLKDFLRLLDSKKELKSLSRNDSAARDASTRKTNTALSKYHRMKDSNIALSDSISSSVHLDNQSGASSRQLEKLPMMAGTSVSPGSSLGRQLSPHTPYTPIIPSRLSANSVVDYSVNPPRRSRRSVQPQPKPDLIAQEDMLRGSIDKDVSHAINIPSSPRPWTYGRRSSSVRQQRSVEEEVGYAHRPYSLPADDRDLSVAELSINESRQTSDQASSEEKIDDARSGDEASPGDFASAAPRTRYSSTVDPGHGHLARRTRGSLSRRGTPTFGHSHTPSSASQSGVVAGNSISERGGTRGSPSLRNSTQEEEALIFELSDMDSRRSLEENTQERGNSRGGRWGR